MKTIKSILLLGVLNMFFVNANNAFSQNTEFNNFFRAGAEDANKLVGYYMEPIIVGFSYGMSNSWYNTAKTHKPLGFDLTITANMTSVPSSRETFLFDPSEYRYVTSTGETNQIPTIMGSGENNGSQLTFNYYDELTGETVSGSYEPQGLGFREKYGYNVVPSPMIQLTVGTVKNTDIILRYTPKITYGAFETNVFGLGIKHDIKQWMPGIKALPFDWSMLAGFSGFNNKLDMSDFEMNGSNQEAIFNVNNWTIQTIASKQLSVVTFYGAVGYSKVSSALNIRGSYIIEDEINPDLSFTVVDPVDISYKESSWRATGGMRLKLGFFTLHADYTWQAYHIVSGGFGFSFR